MDSFTAISWQYRRVFFAEILKISKVGDAKRCGQKKSPRRGSESIGAAAGAVRELKL